MAVGIVVGLLIGSRGDDRDGVRAASEIQAEDPFAAGSPGDPNHHDHEDASFARSTLWPDGTMDVCVAPQGVGGASQEDVQTWLTTTYVEFSQSETGMNLGLAEVGPIVDVTCTATPRFDPSAEDVASTARDWKVSANGPYDIYVFLYPQSVVDALGERWDERIYTYEMLFEEDSTSGYEVSKAVYLSEAELADRGLRDRLILTALGVVGPWGSDRPNIDGACVGAAPAECTPDPLDQE
jgi:hypothetical protein